MKSTARLFGTQSPSTTAFLLTAVLPASFSSTAVVRTWRTFEAAGRVCLEICVILVDKYAIFLIILMLRARIRAVMVGPVVAGLRVATASPRVLSLVSQQCLEGQHLFWHLPTPFVSVFFFFFAWSECCRRQAKRVFGLLCSNGIDRFVSCPGILKLVTLFVRLDSCGHVHSDHIFCGGGLGEARFFDTVL